MPIGMTYASETVKGPCTLCTKMQKIQLSSIHNALFCQNCSDFQQFNL